jgi:hypothetical protein
MNVTAPDGGSAAAISDAAPGQTFGRGDVFGVFLTLAFCLLAQPYGSLVYRRSCGMFWRLHPMLCATEALVIYYYLACTLSTPMARGRDWFTRLHAGATALLLLRAAVDNKDREQLVQRLLSTSFLEVEGAELAVQQRTPEANALTSLAARDAACSTPASSSAERAVIPNPDRAVEEADIAEAYASALAVSLTSDDHAENTGIWHSGSVQPPARTLADRMEAGLGQHNPPNDKAAVLREALGGNILAHREFLVDVATMISIVTILLKLAFTTMAWEIEVATWLMVAGWIAVQLVLLIAHRRELEDVEVRLAIHIARRIDDELRNPNRWLCFGVFAIYNALYGYLSYLAFFRLSISVTCINGLGFLVLIFLLQLVPQKITELVFSFVLKLSSRFLTARLQALASRFLSWISKTVFDIMFFGLFLFLPLLGSPLFRDFRDVPHADHPVLVLVFVLSDLVTYKLWLLGAVAATMIGIGLSVQYSVLLLRPSVFLGSRVQANSDSHPAVIAEPDDEMIVTNLVVAALACCVVIAAYDETGSKKPDWLDWLG